MIAMALACDPQLLIADEPTTALDVTVQAQILELLAELQAELGMAILLDHPRPRRGRRRADDVTVMYAGRVVETRPGRRRSSPARRTRTRGPARARSRRSTAPRRRPPPIPGRPPSPDALPPGCPFAPALRAVPRTCADELSRR